MKRSIPLLICSAVGFILILAYFVPSISELAEMASIHFDILAAIAFILGGGNLLRSHGEKIYKKQAGWGYSVIAVVCFVVTLYVGLAKVGVPPKPGYWTRPVMKRGQTVGLAQLDLGEKKRTLSVTVRKGPADAALDVFIGDQKVGTLKTNGDGRGTLVVKCQPPEPGQSPDPEQQRIGGILAGVRNGVTIRIGDLLSGQLEHYSWITGDYNANGSAFWFAYQYAFQPLQQTIFAMLAFYVASAAFRAFRARNIESVLLLGTAFLILLGRTFVGTWMTSWLPDEGWPSFFQVPNLVVWVMQVFNTAGQRAIMIGIALGVASTSLKVLLGIDRSYLGSE